MTLKMGRSSEEVNMAGGDLYYPGSGKQDGFELGFGVNRLANREIQFLDPVATTAGELEIEVTVISSDGSPKVQTERVATVAVALKEGLVFGKSVTWRFADNESDEQEAELLENEFKFSVTTPFGGLSSAEALKKAHARRDTNHTAYAIFESANTPIRPTAPFALSKPARDYVDAIENVAATPAEAATMFTSKFGTHFVAAASMGFKWCMYISASKTNDNRTLNFRDQLDVSVGFLGFGVSVVSTEQQTASQNLTKFGMTSSVDVRSAGAYRGTVDADGNLVRISVKLPVMVNSLADFAKFIEVVGKDDIWFEPCVTGFEIRDVITLADAQTISKKVFVGLRASQATRTEILKNIGMGVHGELTGRYMYYDGDDAKYEVRLWHVPRDDNDDRPATVMFVSDGPIGTASWDGAILRFDAGNNSARYSAHNRTFYWANDPATQQWRRIDFEPGWTQATKKSDGRSRAEGPARSRPRAENRDAARRHESSRSAHSASGVLDVDGDGEQLTPPVRDSAAHARRPGSEEGGA